MLRGKSDQFLIHGFETNEVELGLDSKMAEGMTDFQTLQLDVSPHGSQEVVGLRSEGFGGQLAQRSMLFERLMVSFNTKSLMRFSTVFGKSS